MAKGINVVINGEYNDKDIQRALRDLEKLQKESQGFGSKFEALGKKTEAVGKKMAGAGAALTKGVTLPIVGLGAAAVKGFADFDSAMTQSTAIMGNVSEEVRDRMSAAARDVATSLNISHKEAAESFFFLASAGLDAEQSIAALPRVAAFAKAGMFDMATATDLATDAQSALGMTSDDAITNLENLSRVTDVFVKANTLANATVEQFSEAITAKAGVALRNAGKDIEEGTAVLSVFADQGVKGSQAGTTLARTLEGLQDNARKNAGAFDELNVQVYDSEGAMRPMVDIVRDMEGAFEGMTTEERNAAIAKLGFNKLAKQGILALVGNSDALEDYESGLRSAGGTVDEVAGKQLETFSEKLGLLKQQFADIAIEFGPLIIDQFLRPLGEMFSNIAKRISELTPGQREMIVRFAGIAAAVGPVLLIVGKFLIVIGKIIAVVNPLSLKIAAIIAIVALLALGFKYLWENSETLRNTVQSVWDTIQSVIQRVVDRVKKVLDENRDAIESVKSAFQSIVQFIVDNVVPVIVTFYSTYLKVLIETIGFLIEAIIETIAFFVRFAAKLIEIGTAIAEWVNMALGHIGRFLETIKTNISNAFNAVKDFISGVFDSIYKTITGTVRSAVNFAIGAINRLINAWNSLNFSIPAVTIGIGPASQTFGPFSIGTPKLPNIPALAEGGIVRRPTLALVGEAGPEAVIPLRNQRAGVNGTTINLTVNAGLGADGGEVGRQIVDVLKQYERRNGPVYVSA